jgi:hypothetical protein
VHQVLVFSKRNEHFELFAAQITLIISTPFGRIRLSAMLPIHVLRQRDMQPEVLTAMATLKFSVSNRFRSLLNLCTVMKLGRIHRAKHRYRRRSIGGGLRAVHMRPFRSWHV